MKTAILPIIITAILLVPSLLVDKQVIFMPILLFSILIIFISLYFSKSKYFFFLIAILNLLYHLFFSYFKKAVEPWDIYNFFTHLSEVVDSFTGMFSLFVVPILVFVVTVFIISKLKLKTYPLKAKIKYPILLFLLLININTIVGFKVVDAVLNTISNPMIKQTLHETPLYPIRDLDTNIILVIGESMKYNDYVQSKLKSLGYFHKKIYAGGTNTDVSVPLLLNAKTNPLELSKINETNLFKLAKKNGFYTTFYSMQSEKALKYIKPFLQTAHIDNYKSFDKKSRKPKYDFLLLDLLKNIDFSQKNFIVLQQIGEHSPYSYFEGKKYSDLKINYNKSIDYSFELFKKVNIFLKATKEPFTLIFTSDHGEFTGEGGRWGHNAFEKIIYEVPFFSSIELPQIKSHDDLSQYLIYALGYKKEFSLDSKKAIINGTMQSREDGFIEVKY